jgi:predicted nucleotidyltransferase
MRDVSGCASAPVCDSCGCSAPGARAEAREDSDVDVAVVVEGLTRDEWRDAVGDAVDVELATEVTMSPYVVSGEHFDLLCKRERRIARDILEEGIAA